MCSHTELLTETFSTAHIDLEPQLRRYGVTDGVQSRFVSHPASLSAAMLSLLSAVLETAVLSPACHASV